MKRTRIYTKPGRYLKKLASAPRTCAAVAALQVLLFALAAAGVRNLGIFNNTEFLMLTLISMTQAIVAILINARTLRRTIGVGDN